MDSYRKDKLSKLEKYIKKDISKEIENQFYKLSKNISKDAGLEHLIENIYLDKVNDLINAFDNNKDLLDDINSKKISPEKVVLLEKEELNPSNYEAIISKNAKEQALKSEKKTTDAFKCGQCKKRECEVEERQDRAGDEPSTTHITCINCGNKWKQ